MSPMMASILERMGNDPGALDGYVIASGASMAITHIRRLEKALEKIVACEHDTDGHATKRMAGLARAALEH